jgi:type I restriction enzyme, S subunit
MKISDYYTYAPKSKIKAGDANPNGKYQFYTSSPDESRRCDEYLYDCKAIVMGTGGSATLHYYDGKFSTSTDCLTLIPNEKIRAKYLYYFFLANMDVLEAGFKGAGLKHTSKGYIDNIEITKIPSLPSQDKIVNLFDELALRIEKERRQIEKLDELVKARFVEMFENDNMNEKTIEDVASFCSRGKSPKYVTKSKLKVINQACIYWDRFKFENVKYNEEDYDGDRIISNNDLLICSTGTGTLGRCNIFRAPDDSRYMADSHVTIIRLNGHILPEVFKAWFERPRTQEKLYSDCVSGSTNQIELSKEKLKNMNILVPPINLQKTSCK